MVPAAVFLALPAAGFVLLLAAPGADAHWENHPTHFWLVLATALVNVVLGLAASEAARRRGDAGRLLVSLTRFLASAGFLALHALAAPGSLIEGKSVGFVIATPVGLMLAAGFAAASSASSALPGERRAVDRRRALAARLGAGLVRGLRRRLASSELAPLDPAAAAGAAPAPSCSRSPRSGSALYAFATLRYVRLARQRQDPLPGALAAAWVLLAEALLATGRRTQLAPDRRRSGAS